MRTYLILKEKAQRWKPIGKYRESFVRFRATATALRTRPLLEERAHPICWPILLTKTKFCKKRLPYERLDQLTVDMLLGVR